jgi:leucyl-tRNA synthetase
MTMQDQPTQGPAHRYTAKKATEIELARQAKWLAEQTFRQPNPGEHGFDASRPKFYCLDMFPYPSGAGLHVGHPEGYTATDIISRYKRMRGFNVLHPMGWDAFGLPAEQYAIQTGVHPAITTKASINTFRAQLQRFGFSYDWSRECGTIDPEYYKWTQWIFTKVYDAWMDSRASKARPISDLVAALERGELAPQVNSGSDVEPLAPAPASWAACSAPQRRTIIDSYRLAYLGETTVNWCPKLGTVLANDEVIDGRSERGGYPVLRKPMKQWMFRITAFAQRLLEQLDPLEWPESTKAMQREWIGKSEGAEIEFEVASRVARRSAAGPEGGPPTGGPPVDGPPTGGPPLCGESTSGPPLRGESTGGPPLRGGSSLPCPATTLSLARSRHLKPRGFEPRDPFPEGMKGAAPQLTATYRNLPHFNLPGATYFVTWRTSTTQVLDESDRRIVLEALSHFDGQRCRSYVACVMPDHVHWIVKPLGTTTLDELVKSVKHFTATAINKSHGRKGHLWQDERFDHIVRDRQAFNEAVEYTLSNPVKAGLCADAGEYLFSVVHEEVLDEQVGSGGPAAERRATQEATQEATLRVFTTRPDTIFGATYMVVAPEHEIVDAILAAPGPRTDVEKVRAYVSAARNRSDIERMENKEKTGVDLGVDAINPATGHAIPVHVADYVLTGYGTGAIMAVPAHDQRDFDFAQTFGLPIKDVIYGRTVLAMRYFSQHATPAEQEGDRWAGVLADFLGWTTSSNATEEQFPESLRLIRERRSAAQHASADSDHKERRNVRDTVWLDALQDLKIASFHDLAKRFATQTFHARSGGAFEGHGTLVHSANAEVSINNLSIDEAKRTIIAWLASKNRGQAKVNFRLRDWTFSRQRYWGEPFPIVFDDAGNHYPVSERALPVTLPELADYAPVESNDPQPLLAKAAAWARTTAGAAGVEPALLPPSTPVTRECNTMPGSAGSSWYFNRFCDAHNANRFTSREAERYWMGGLPGGPPLRSGSSQPTSPAPGVDLYIGGSEHAVGHLLYSRFWQNVLYDLGEACTPEPFRKLFHQGMITSFAYQRSDKSLVPIDQVEEVAEGDAIRYVQKGTGDRLTQTIAKMSKTLKNVVNPDDIINEYGADTFRIYEMYMGPLEASKPWNTKDIIGPFRFLQRVWRNVLNEETGQPAVTDAPIPPDLEKKLHRTIADVTSGIETLSLHTAIAKMIELNNDLTKVPGGPPRHAVETLLVLLSPFAPHICEELWEKLGHTTPLSRAPWPTFDPAKLVDAQIEIPVSILGKVRSRVMVPTGADAPTTEAKALADPKIVELIAGKPIKKIIVVPGKMVNIVHG